MLRNLICYEILELLHKLRNQRRSIGDSCPGILRKPHELVVVLSHSHVSLFEIFKLIGNSSVVVNAKVCMFEQHLKGLPIHALHVITIP